VKPLLALFDVDGTLFLTDDLLAGEALLVSLRELYPVDPPADAVGRVDHRGQTSLRIMREVLRSEGLRRPAIDQRLGEACDLFARRYLGLLEGADTNSWEAGPGAAEALERLRAGGMRLALLTGNPEPVAAARMARLGLEGFFPRGQGAFGCDAEERSMLFEIARERAGAWPAERTVEIGDTPRDVSTAHGAGVRAVAVRSPRQHEGFSDADAVCDDLETVADVLLAWNRGP
jgi:phosphoglycolate phosphatase